MGNASATSTPKRGLAGVLALGLMLGSYLPMYAHGGGGHFSGGGGHFSGGGHMSSFSSHSFSSHSFSSPHMSSFGGSHSFSGFHSSPSFHSFSSSPSFHSSSGIDSSVQPHLDSIFGGHHSNAAESINRTAPFNENSGFFRHHSSVNVEPGSMPTQNSEAMGSHHHLWPFGHHSDAINPSVMNPSANVQGELVGNHHHFWSSHNFGGAGMYGEEQGIRAERPFTIEDVPVHEHQVAGFHNVNDIPVGSHHWLKEQYAMGAMTPPIMPHIPSLPPVTPPVIVTAPRPIFTIPHMTNCYYGPSYYGSLGSGYGMSRVLGMGYYGTGYGAYGFYPYSGYGYGNGMYGYGGRSMVMLLWRLLSLLGLGGYSYSNGLGSGFGMGTSNSFDPYANVPSAIGSGFAYNPNAYASAGGVYDPNAYANGGSAYDPNAYANSGGVYDPNAFANSGGVYDPNAYANGGSAYDPNAYANSGGAYDPNANPYDANASTLASAPPPLPPFAAYGDSTFRMTPSGSAGVPAGTDMSLSGRPSARGADNATGDEAPLQVALSATAQALPPIPDRPEPPKFRQVGFNYHRKGILGAAFAHSAAGLPPGSYRTPSVLAIVFSHQFWQEQMAKANAPSEPGALATQSPTTGD